MKLWFKSSWLIGSAVLGSNKSRGRLHRILLFIHLVLMGFNSTRERGRNEERSCEREREGGGERGVLSMNSYWMQPVYSLKPNDSRRFRTASARVRFIRIRSKVKSRRQRAKLTPIQTRPIQHSTARFKRTHQLGLKCAVQFRRSNLNAADFQYNFTPNLQRYEKLGCCSQLLFYFWLIIIVIIISRDCFIELPLLHMAQSVDV